MRRKIAVWLLAFGYGVIVLMWFIGALKIGIWVMHWAFGW